MSLSPLLHGPSLTQPDIRWFTGYACGDPLLVFGVDGQRVGFVGRLEVAPARAESRLDEVHDLGERLGALRKERDDEKLGVGDLLVVLAAEYGIERFQVPREFPVGLYRKLCDLGCEPEVCDGPLFADRALKTAAEAEAIREANRAAAAGLAAVREMLADSRPNGEYLELAGEPLTAERLRRAVYQACAAHGALCVGDAIAAPGVQAVDCHCHGSGPVRAGELVVVDIYPQLIGSGYCGDMTRTFCRGKPSAEQQRLVAAVREAHDFAVEQMRAGAKVKELHEAVQERFKSLGYENIDDTEPRQGYTHGLGHGVGLQVHEPAMRPDVEALEAGAVITVEPGLYYLDIGGCRIEDVVRVTDAGPQLLSEFDAEWVV